MNLDDFFVRIAKFCLSFLCVIFFIFYVLPNKHSIFIIYFSDLYYWFSLIPQYYFGLISHFFSYKIFEPLLKIYLNSTVLNRVSDLYIITLLYTKETESYIFFLLQVLFLVILMIWARAAGPRFRLDQLVNITWKDLFIYTSLLLFAVMYIGIIY